MDEEKKINNIKEEHTCDTCKWYNPKLTYIEKEECHGCCSWNDKWEERQECNHGRGKEKSSSIMLLNYAIAEKMYAPSVGHT